MKKIGFYIVLFLLGSCGSETPEFYTTEHGLKYKYHDINSDEITPKRGDYLTVYMQWKTLTDSVFYDSRTISPSGKDVIMLGKAKHLGGIEEGFAKLQQGDSVSFYINPQRFYQDYLALQEVPQFLKGEEEMVITLRLLAIESEKAYLQKIEEQKEVLELQELKEVNRVVEQWNAKYDSVIEIDGSYMVLAEPLDSTKLIYGSVIQLNYEASFINGVTFYSTYKNGFPDEFQLGKEGQMVEGLSNALSKMYYNQKAKVLVPSYKGFGSEGSPGKVIPPFTPIIYDISVLPLTIK